MRPWIVPAILALGVALQLHGADLAPRYSGQPLMRVFTERETGGAPRNHAVAVHPSGLVYLANGTGLREFDGVNWRVIRGLESAVVRNVAIDPAGQVFYSGNNYFGRLVPSAEGARSAEPLQTRLPAESQELGLVLDIVPDRGGAYFLAETRGLVIRADADGTVHPIPIGERGLLLLRWEDAVYAVNLRKIFRLEGTRAVPGSDSLAALGTLGRDIAAIWPRPEGGAWVVTGSGGLRLWQDGTTPIVSEELRRLLGADIVSCACPIGDGTIAIGTRAHGVIIVSAEGKVLSRYDEDNGLGPGSGFTEGLAMDAEGGLWVAHDGGVTRVAARNPGALHGLALGLRGRPLALAMHRGKLHVATSQAVFVRDPATGRFTPIAGTRQGTTSLISTEEGLLACGSGVLLIRDTGEVEEIGHPAYVRCALRLPGDPDRVVMGTSDGVCVFRRTDGRWRFEGVLAGVRDTIVQVVTDAAGWLWALREPRQILRIDWRNGARLDAPVQILGQAQGVEKLAGIVRLELLGGTIVMLGRDTLLRHDPASDRFGPETRIAGLNAAMSSQFFFALGDDVFWLARPAAPRGIGFVRRTGLDAWKLSGEPLSGFEPNPPSAVLSDPAHGTLWLGGKELVSYDLNRPRLESPAPAARVRQIADTEQKQIWGEALADRPLVLPPERNELVFSVTAARFETNVNGVVPLEYRTWLEGFDHTWSNWSRATARTYTNLPPGPFTFHVQAQAEDRPGPPSALAFTLLAPPLPWWRTWWFIGLAGASGMGAVASVSRWFAHRALRRRVQLLEAQAAVEAERLRLARDMHDDLGSGLGRIALLGGLALVKLDDRAAAESNLRKITETVQALGRSTRDIIWAVNPHNDTVPELAAHLARLAEETLGEAGIRCAIELAPDLLAVTLGAGARHAALLAVKEALHNAVKYSGATTAEFSARVEGGALVFTLRDHGRGFAPGEQRGTGHGLKSIAARLATTGGSGEVIGTPGEGTIVRLKLPLPEV